MTHPKGLTLASVAKAVAFRLDHMDHLSEFTRIISITKTK